MKKTIAVLLALLCLLSSMSVLSLAANDPFEDIFGEEDEPIVYTVSYSCSTGSVKVMYYPTPQISRNGKGEIIVTNDYPIAINHDFVCWQDENGKEYYGGDSFYVDGTCTLTAVWKEKTDNESNVIRVIRCALLTFERMILKALGIFKILDSEKKNYDATTTTESTTLELI